MSFRGWIARVFTPFRMMILFTLVNMFNYMDRGIAPGCIDDITKFIEDSTGSTEDSSTRFGLVQSAFIAGFAFACMIFGHLVHFFPPFKLMTVGLMIWCGAVILSGLAPNYGTLIFARMLSGVGEASFQTVVPPFLDDNAPKKQRALWLSIFFSAIPVGTALGYAYGAEVAEATSWRWSFMIEAPMMFPFALLVWFLPYHKRYDGHEEQDGAASASSASSASSSAAAEERQRMLAGATPRTPEFAYDPETPGAGLSEADGLVRMTEAEREGTFTGKKKPSALDELKVVLGSPTFVFTVLGYSAFTWVVAGFAAFGPRFLHDLDIIESNTTASVAFGGLVSITGFIGTPLGGLVLDWLSNRNDQRQCRQLGLVGPRGAHQLVASTALESGSVNRSAAAAASSSSSSGAASPKPGSATRRGRLEISSDGGPPIGYSDSPSRLPYPVAGSDTVGGAGSLSGRGGSEEDKESGGDEDEESEAQATRPRMLDVKLTAALPFTVALISVAAGLCILSPFVSTGVGPFFGCLAVGCLFLFATTAPINQSIMASVPPENRPFAIGIGTVVTHALGDVPSPIVIGAIQDALSSRGAAGERLTLFLVALWLLWAVVLWSVAYAFALRKQRRNVRLRLYEELGGPGHVTGRSNEWPLCGTWNVGLDGTGDDDPDAFDDPDGDRRAAAARSSNANSRLLRP